MRSPTRKRARNSSGLRRDQVVVGPGLKSEETLSGCYSPSGGDIGRRGAAFKAHPAANLDTSMPGIIQSRMAEKGLGALQRLPGGGPIRSSHSPHNPICSASLRANGGNRVVFGISIFMVQKTYLSRKQSRGDGIMPQGWALC